MAAQLSRPRQSAIGVDVGAVLRTGAGLRLQKIRGITQGNRAEEVCGLLMSNRNWAKACSPGFDEALTAGRQGLTFEERYEAYSRFQRKFAEQVPVIILDKPETGYYYTDEVSGVFMSVRGQLLLAFAAKG